jgi:hypothetical protein
VACVWNDDAFHTHHDLECLGNMLGGCVHFDKVEVRENRSILQPEQAEFLAMLIALDLR